MASQFENSISGASFADVNRHPGLYEIIIKRQRGLGAIEWRAIGEFKDLLWLLVRRDFLTKYRQTVLGPFWSLLQPLMMTIVFSVVFGKIAGIPTDSLPPMLFYLCGLLGWNYFAQNVLNTANTFTANMHLFGKVYFPRLIVPLAAVISNLITFFIQLMLFAGFWIYFKFFTESATLFALEWSALLLPLVLFHTAILSLGIGLWFSAFTAKYRDLLQILGLVVQLWLYATPVIYPMSQVIAQLPEKYSFLVGLNPMAPVVEIFRYSLLGEATVSLSQYFISLVISVFLFFSGVLVFQKTERTFVDTV